MDMRERAARIVEGEPYKERYRKWPSVSAEGNRSVDSELVKHCDILAAAIRAIPDDWVGDELARLRASHARLLEALKDCAGDLESWVEDAYASTKHHPASARRYKRDMEPVHQARDTIAAAEGAGE